MVNYAVQSWYNDIVRGIFSHLDAFIYNVLTVCYQIFFNIATADILQGGAVKQLFNRIHIVLGIIIIFKVAISLFNGIVNPDSLKDGKKGVGSVFKRIALVLLMLALIVPLDIPGSFRNDDSGQSSWNRNLNNHGILFGTLYEIQRRILEGDVIPRLILGVSDDGTKDESYFLGGNGATFSKDILKTLLTVNVAEEDAVIESADDCDDDDTLCVCEYDADEEAYDKYFDGKTNVDQLLYEVNAWCMHSGNMSDAAKDNGFEEDAYVFSYLWPWTTIIGILFCLLILSLAVDTGIRLFKLVILEIISPIAILAYIDPKGDNTFQNWIKTLINTFLAIFIRIAIISFIVFIMRMIADNGLGLEVNGGMIGLVSKILIYLALLMFAKEAPKFITSTLGLKETGGLFGGLAALAGFGSSTASGVKSMVKTIKNDSDEPQTKRNKAKAVVSGLISGVGGAHDAYYGYENAKDKKWRTSLDAVNRTNDTRLRNAELGSAWWNSPIEQFKQDFTGSSTYGALQRQIQGLKAQQEKLQEGYDTNKARMDAVSGLQQYGIDEALKKGGGFFKFNGRDIDIKNFNSAVEAAKGAGKDRVEFMDSNGGRQFMSLNDAINNLGNYSKEAGASYIINNIDNSASGVKEKVVAANFGATPGQEIVIDNTTLAADLNNAIGSLKGEFNKNMTDIMYGYTDSNNKHQKGISDIKKDIADKERESKKAYAALAGNDNRPGGK